MIDGTNKGETTEERLDEEANDSPKITHLAQTPQYN